MGTSTDAYFYFGFDCWAEDDGEPAPWSDPEAEEEDDSEDWDDVYLRRAHPNVVPADLEYKQRKAILDAGGGHIDCHCHHDCSIWFVCVPRLFFKAYRGSPCQIEEVPEPTDAEIEALRRFCDVMGIKWQKPKWHLASYWG